MSINNIYSIFLLIFINEKMISSISTNNTSSSNEEPKKIIDSKKSFNMTINEMDTMMLCTIIVQESLKKYDNKINQIQKKLNLSTSNVVSEKIATDIFEKCVKNLNISIVNYFIKNLTFINDFKWRKNFDEIIDINFDKYKNKTDLEYTMDQQILMYKFEKTEEIYKQKEILDREMYEKENRKIRIGKVELQNIPNSFKLGIFLVILIVFFGGIFYFLGTLKAEKKEKKKKKKTQ